MLFVLLGDEHKFDTNFKCSNFKVSNAPNDPFVHVQFKINVFLQLRGSMYTFDIKPSPSKAADRFIYIYNTRRNRMRQGTRDKKQIL